MNAKMEKLRNRQLARLLSHLKRTGQLTVELEKDLKRSFRFVFEDLETILNQQVHDKKNSNGRIAE
jgi:glutamine synthetase adenylyltransferase